MNVTHKKVHTIYKVLYTIKQLSNIITKKIKVKTFNKSQCSGLFMQLVIRNMCWQL